MDCNETPREEQNDHTYGGEQSQFSRDEMRYLFHNNIKEYNKELRRMFPGVPDIEYVSEKRYDNKSTVIKGLGLLVLSSAAAFFGNKIFPIENSTIRSLAYEILPTLGIGGMFAYFGGALVDFVHYKEVEQLCEDLPNMYPPATLFPMLPGETMDEYKKRFNIKRRRELGH